MRVRTVEPEQPLEWSTEEQVFLAVERPAGPDIRPTFDARGLGTFGCCVVKACPFPAGMTGKCRRHWEEEHTDFSLMSPTLQMQIDASYRQATHKGAA